MSVSSSAVRMARKRVRDKELEVVRRRAEVVSAQMSAAFPGRDVLFEGGRGDRAVAYAKGAGDAA